MEAEKKSFDLASFSYLDEADIEILDVRGEKTGWVWTMAGPGHPLTVALTRKISDRYLKRQNEIQRAQVNNKNWKGEEETTEELFANSVEHLVTRTLRWSEMTMNGADFPCTPENVRKVLLRHGGVVYGQINAFTREEQSFTPRSDEN